MLKKTTLREIRQSLGRFIAILAIVALGVGFFSGLKVTREAMISTADGYLTQHKLYDYELISTLGFDDKSVRDVAATTGVRTVEGSISRDIIISCYDGADRVFKALSITDKTNTPNLVAGRMPHGSDECVVDSSFFNKSDIGKYVTLSKVNARSDKNSFVHNKYKITGLATSPLYLNFERGSSDLGNGSISAFFYINESGFDVDYYSEIYVLLDNDDAIYSKGYKDSVKTAKSDMKAAAAAATTARYHDIVSDARASLAKQEKKFNDSYATYLSEKSSAYSKLDAAAARLTSSERTIASKKSALKTNKNTLLSSKAKIQAGLTTLAQKRAEFEQNKQYMTPEQAAATEAALNAQESSLNASLAKVNKGLAAIAAGSRQLAAAENSLKSGWSEYHASRTKADTRFAEAKSKLDDGRAALNKAKHKIRDIESGKSYALTRSINVGYVCFESDSDIVNGVARVFPIFFFLVAALVCMTTMTRMIDEQRTQIGVFKALGYSNSAVLGKYMFYSGSAASIGAISGFLIGCWIFPAVIWRAYGMMYNFDNNIDYVLNAPLAAISFGVALLCSMGATWLSCSGDFSVAPAELIRPKAPKAGKRILLERINFIWKRISFLYKVSLRNIFRYKKRFFMMVLGISGCTALLIAGFGINDTIKNIANFQFDEITTYDYSVNFDNNMTSAAQQDFRSYSKGHAGDILFVHDGSADFVKGDREKSIRLVSADGANFNTFVKLHYGNKKIAFPKSGQAVICRKLNKQYGVKAGDTIKLRDGYREMKVKVAAICDNYVYDYIFISNDTYTSGFGKAPAVKTAYVVASNNKSATIHEEAAYSDSYENTSGTNINQDMRKRIDKMMYSLNAVIILVVLSAGMLAFIVLYNLTNINITERIREIATIEVLGFYPREISAYVFRENFFLTGISALVGIPLGRWLLSFVIDQIQVDLVYFTTRITVMSYVWSILLTFVFAIIVSIVMFRKLNRISMTESLKSIE
jgi:putative ABC transport system permease protein